MKLYILVGVLAALASPSFAQQPTYEKPSTAPGSSDAGAPPLASPDPPCAADDALCILAQNLKKKDRGTGSSGGSLDGLYTIQKPIPGGRIDLQFLRKNEILG